MGKLAEYNADVSHSSFRRSYRLTMASRGLTRPVGEERGSEQRRWFVPCVVLSVLGGLGLSACSSSDGPQTIAAGAGAASESEQSPSGIQGTGAGTGTPGSMGTDGTSGAGSIASPGSGQDGDGDTSAGSAGASNGSTTGVAAVPSGDGSTGGGSNPSSGTDDGTIDDQMTGTDGEGGQDDQAGEAEPEVVSVIPLGPTAADGSANFPFPQNRELPNCGMPSNISNDDVMAAYEAWRAATVTQNGAGDNAYRVQRLPSDPMIADETDDTVSEGIAYGLLIAVYMNDQDLFDGLWRYEQRFLDAQGLMHWHINAAGTAVIGEGAASDADEDMAWAMIMADRQWGGGGSLGGNYIDIARDLIEKMWAHEVLDGKLFLPGDQFGDWGTVNVSYFTPNYFRLFGEISGNPGWNDVVVTSYDALEATLKPEYGNQDSGLVPAWSSSDGVPNGGAWGPNGSSPTHHQYDSCRTPFRIGLDYCFNAEPRSKSYVDKITAFYAGLGVDGMTDGYELNGQARPQFGGLSAAFVGPAAVGAMSDPATYQQFLDDAYDRLKTLDLLVGGEYYDRSWTVISLLMLTGNFLDYTKIEPL